MLPSRKEKALLTEVRRMGEEIKWWHELLYAMC